MNAPKYIALFANLVRTVLDTKFLPDSFKRAGGRLNKKDGLTRYGDSHVKDKTS